VMRQSPPGLWTLGRLCCCRGCCDTNIPWCPLHCCHSLPGAFFAASACSQTERFMALVL
jgi:hypothetical protein